MYNALSNFDLSKRSTYYAYICNLSICNSTTFKALFYYCARTRYARALCFTLSENGGRIIHWDPWLRYVRMSGLLPSTHEVTNTRVVCSDASPTQPNVAHAIHAALGGVASRRQRVAGGTEDSQYPWAAVERLKKHTQPDKWTYATNVRGLCVHVLRNNGTTAPLSLLR